MSVFPLDVFEEMRLLRGFVATVGACIRALAGVSAYVAL